MHRHEFLDELSELITTEKSSKISAPTGIPPHVHILKSLHEVINLQLQLQNENKQLLRYIHDAFKEAIDDKAAESGHLTQSGVEALLKMYNEEIGKSLVSKIDTLLNKLGHDVRSNNDSSNVSNNSQNRYKMYSYDGKFWDVPQGFAFPEKVTRKKAWEIWLYGFPGYMMKKGNECVKCPIKPFCYITANKLPKPLCNAFKVSWRPILVEMSKAPNLELPNNNDAISSEVIETTYSIASEYLKQKYSCLFTTKNIWTG